MNWQKKMGWKGWSFIGAFVSFIALVITILFQFPTEAWAAWIGRFAAAGLFFALGALIRSISRPRIQREAENLVKDVIIQSSEESEVGEAWSGVRPILFHERIIDSPFQFKYQLDEAQRDLVIIANNARFLTRPRPNEGRPNGYRDILFSTLMKKPDLSVRIMICDSQLSGDVRMLLDKETRRVYSTDVAEKIVEAQAGSILWVMAGFTDLPFVKDYHDSVNALKVWQKEADKLRESQGNMGRLEIKKSPCLGTLLVTFIDPPNWNGTDPRRVGKMVLTPVPYQSEPTSRLCFYFTQEKHRAVFNYYSDKYFRIWRDQARSILTDC